MLGRILNLQYIQTNLDVLAETLKLSTINNIGYYESGKNDAKGNPAGDPKVPTHTSDGKKRKLRTLATKICNKDY